MGIENKSFNNGFVPIWKRRSEENGEVVVIPWGRNIARLQELTK